MPDVLSTSDSHAVVIELVDHMMVITINRPEVRNAVNQAVCLAVGDALESADADPEIRVVVLTGAGEQSFCSGADLKAISRGEAIIPPGREGWGLAGFVNHPISKPTIAAVNGLAIGGGTELALAADLVVASEQAVFGLPEVQRGRLAGAGGAFRLVRQLPERVAVEMLLTGDPISATQALEYRLVNRVVPSGSVRATAMDLARRISANGPLAVQATKRIAKSIQEGRISHERTYWEMTAAEAALVNASADAREGLAAFGEKRAPRWTGR
ncbi:crotonase/enoyl-CoA hydratase family protein [Rhodococcus koreensis]